MTPGEQFGVALPGGTSVSHVRVYDTIGPDGLAGGSPHLHTVCTEAYLVISGEGAVQTLSGEGYAETPLVAGTIAWFSPGTIHRLINLDGRLELYVLMSNAGLPEAGDMILAFEPDLLADDAIVPRASPTSRSTVGPPTARPTPRWLAVMPPSTAFTTGATPSTPTVRMRSHRCTDRRWSCSATGRRTGTICSPPTRPSTSNARVRRWRNCGHPTASRAAERLAESAIRSRSLLPATRNMGCCGTLGTVVH